LKKKDPSQNALQESYQSWKNHSYDPSLSESSSKTTPRTTISGKKIKELYTPLDVENLTYEEDLGFPGVFPYTRGIHPTMYHSRLWTMRQFSGFGSAEDTNKRYKYLLSHGQTGLSVAFHLPTIMGRFVG